MIPKAQRQQIAEELDALSNEILNVKDERDESHVELRLEDLHDRFQHLVGEYSAEILRRQDEQDRIETRKIVDLSDYRG